MLKRIEVAPEPSERPAPRPCERCGADIKAIWFPGFMKEEWFWPPVCEGCITRKQREDHERAAAARLGAWRASFERMVWPRYMRQRVELDPVVAAFANGGASACGHLALYLTGGTGTGKTQAMADLGQRVIDRLAAEGVSGGCPVFYIDIPGVLAALRQQESLDAYERAPWLLLDEVGLSGLTDWAQEQVYSLIKARYLAELPTVFAGNLHPAELLRNPVKGWDDRIIRRIIELCGGVGADKKIRGVVVMDQARWLEVRK